MLSPSRGLRGIPLRQMPAPLRPLRVACCSFRLLRLDASGAQGGERNTVGADDRVIATIILRIAYLPVRNVLDGLQRPQRLPTKMLEAGNFPCPRFVAFCFQ